MASLGNSLSGLPVPKESAERTLSALGEDAWKQIYDGKYHKYGKWVFDLGLHGYEEEPGFYESALKALRFAEQNMGAPLTIDLYRQLHAVACSHFRGEANNTEMDASEAGNFRQETDSGVRCGFTVRTMLTFFDRADLKDKERRTLIREFEGLRFARGSEFAKSYADPFFYERMGKIYDMKYLNYAYAKELENLFQSKTQEIADFLLRLKKDPQLGVVYPKFTWHFNAVTIKYARPARGNFTYEAVVEHVFTEFNRGIAAIDAELLHMDQSDKAGVEKLTDLKLILIADLFQKLEWFHPFPDGQGRTDLITLGMVLSKHGFCPAILDEPYVSSFASLVDWRDYLKEGMKKWQEAVKAAAIFNAASFKAQEPKDSG